MIDSTIHLNTKTLIQELEPFEQCLNNGDITSVKAFLRSVVDDGPSYNNWMVFKILSTFIADKGKEGEMMINLSHSFYRRAKLSEISLETISIGYQDSLEYKEKKQKKARSMKKILDSRVCNEGIKQIAEYELRGNVW